MAIESVSSISPVINRPVQSSSASPSDVAGPENTRAASGVGTRENVSPVAQDTETTLQNSASQISRAYAGNPTPSDTRAASEAYRTEASAQDQLAVQQQGNGTRTVDVMA